MLPNGRVSWQNPQVLLTILTIFLLGATFGALAVKFGMRDVVAPAPYMRSGDKKVIFEKFQRDLQLTPEQSAQLEIVLDDFTMLIQNLQVQMDEVRGDGKQRVLKILTAEQKEKFKKLIGEMPR